MLRFALPRCRPRYIAVTYLVTDPTPARASDPPVCHRLALCSCKFQARRRASRTALGLYELQAGAAALRLLLMLLVKNVTDLRNKDLRADLSNKMRGVSRVTDPNKNS